MDNQLNATKYNKIKWVVGAVIAVIIITIIFLLLSLSGDKTKTTENQAAAAPAAPAAPGPRNPLFSHNGKSSYYINGNNGSVTCSQFCEAKHKPEGQNWFGKPLLDGWKRAQCAGVGLIYDLESLDQTYTCDDKRGVDVDTNQVCLCSKQS
jgi:hypothetical protein